MGAPARLGVLAVAVVGLSALIVVGLLPGAVLAARAAGVVGDRLLDVPALPPGGVDLTAGSVVVDRDGQQLAVLEAEHRVPVESDDLPGHLVDAVVATEDAQFFSHAGVSWRGMARAALSSARAGQITGGGSGITQQLVKNLVVGDERSVRRKVHEAAYALELERRMSKPEILEAYLNEAYFGSGAYGVGAAAQRYWGIDASDLSLAQSATLAGILRLPSATEPIANPEAALSRRAVVLHQMVEARLIDAAQARRAAAEPLALDPQAPPTPRPSGLEAYVRSALDADPALGVNAAQRRRTYERGGLEIRMTIDADLQQHAERIIARHLDGRQRPATTLGAITAVDPRSGEVLVVASGPQAFGSGDGQTQVNPAVPGAGGGGRQAGSAFKAFQLVTALESGIPASYTVDTPSPYEPSQACADLDWAPRSSTGADGGLMDMAQATAGSSNAYFAHLVDRTGPQALAETAARMGVRSPLEAVCPLVLGTADVFPLEMAAAYGTLAADGLRCTPYAVAEVRDAAGHVVSQGGGVCERAVDAEVARRATDLLRGPVESGTASAAVTLDRAAAGKTGTSQEAADAWFVGYLPQLSVAAWVGAEMPAPMTHPSCDGPMTGGCVPARMWDDLVAAAVDELDLPALEFAAPAELPTAVVPDVVGRDVGRARRMLERAGFVVDEATVGDWREDGRVVRSEPRAGGAAPRGSLVRLLASDGSGARPLLPDVVGAPAATAVTALEDVGARVRVVDVGSADESRHGAVVAQSPQPERPAVSRLGRPVLVTVQVGRPLRSGEREPPAPPTQAPPADERGGAA